MELAESDLLFIDVDASTPAVKQEHEETPGLVASPDLSSNLKKNNIKSTSTKKYYKVLNKVPSASQVAYLVERMEKNPVIARGCLRNAPDRQRARRFWEHMCLRLNKIPGTSKTWNQWMKYWTDKKKFVKKKAAHRSKLSDIEEKIFNLGGGMYRNLKRNSVPKIEAETENSNLSELDISDDEFSQKLKDIETDGFLEDTNLIAGPSLNQSIGITPLTTGHNKSTNSKCQNHSQEHSKFERILKIEEHRLSMEQSNAQLMRTILEQSAERERTILTAVKTLSERLNERNERDALMAGALKTLGDGLLALSKVIKNNT